MPSLFHRPTTKNVVVRVPHAESTVPPVYKEYRFRQSDLTTPYFQSQFRLLNASPNSAAPIVVLSNTNVQYFDVYQHWLHNQEIATSAELQKRKKQSLAMGLGQNLGFFKKQVRNLTPDEARADYDNLLCCYALGFGLGDRRFQDAIASKLIQLLRSPNSHQSQFIRLLTRATIQRVIERYSTTSPFVLLLAKAYARFASVHEIQLFAFADYPGHFKSQVMQALASLREKQHIDGNAATDFAVSECRFHAHGFYEPCNLRRR